MANKVKYGLKNVHYAVATLAQDGSATYSAPVAIPGAVNLSLSAEGEINKFYADGIVYHSVSANNGYSGSLEIAKIPDSFRKDVLGEIEDDNGVLVESADAKTVEFALLFEFDGDVSQVKHVLYKCVATRPSIESATKEESVEIKTETLELTATSVYNADIDANITKSKVEDTDSTAYASWYTAVYQPVKA